MKLVSTEWSWWPAIIVGGVRLSSNPRFVYLCVIYDRDRFIEGRQVWRHSFWQRSPSSTLTGKTDALTCWLCGEEEESLDHPRLPSPAHMLDQNSHQLGASVAELIIHPSSAPPMATLWIIFTRIGWIMTTAGAWVLRLLPTVVYVTSTAKEVTKLATRQKVSSCQGRTKSPSADWGADIIRTWNTGSTRSAECSTLSVENAVWGRSL